MVCNDILNVFLLLDTRWDSDLRLLEHCIYFDAEILELCRTQDIDMSLALDTDAFDLARLMVDVLLHLRKFSKFCEHKSMPTLCYVPKMV